MAGGMVPRDERPTLTERGILPRPTPPATQSRAQGNNRSQDSSQSQGSSRAPGGTGGRHCWVLDPAGLADPMPGLLTEWRQVADGWLGLVAFVADIGTGTPVLVQTWVEASRLRPLP